jgi:hypothetical protein
MIKRKLSRKKWMLNKVMKEVEAKKKSPQRQRLKLAPKSRMKRRRRSILWKKRRHRRKVVRLMKTSPRKRNKLLLLYFHGIIHHQKNFPL